MEENGSRADIGGPSPHRAHANVLEVPVTQLRRSRRPLLRYIADQPPARAARGLKKENGQPPYYANRLVTGAAFTSSRGWFRWLYTIVAGSMPTAW